MKPLVLLNYPLDLTRLLAEADEIKKTAESYVDGRYNNALDYWKIARDYGDYGKQILEDFGLGGKPRYYWLAANSYLPEHTDHNTQCSINFVLSKNLAPVTVENVDYFYTQALLNTSVRHSVRNGPEERILFKISIFDKTFEEVSEIIKYKL